MTYPDTQLLIDGKWRDALDGRTLPVLNPATDAEIGRVAHAGIADLDLALAAAHKGFETWRKTPAIERAKIMRRAAALMRERAADIAPLLTQEQGKPLPEAKMETLAAADIIEWFADEGLRVYGRIVPGRNLAATQMVLKDPVGPVAAFTPWNFPINQVVRKASAALATGCSIIVKAPEETPASPAELIRCFADAGVPAGVIGLVYGVPAEISEYLIPHPVIRKISFTGSVPVGKHLIKLAADTVKRTTMELGGHAPVLVFDDAPQESVLDLAVLRKYRNAGQVCVSPTRFYIQNASYDAFCAGFAERAARVRVGDGLDPATMMGPMVHARRRDSIESLVQDAVAKGARLLAGGERVGNDGFFYAPTVLADVPDTARIMSEEPFGPVAVLNRFAGIDDAIAKANSLPYGLAAYAFTQSVANIHRLSDEIEAGMFGINSFNISMPETPFGGVKESGLGSEVGTEGLDAYLVTRTISVT